VAEQRLQPLGRKTALDGPGREEVTEAVQPVLRATLRVHEPQSGLRQPASRGPFRVGFFESVPLHQLRKLRLGRRSRRASSA